MTVLWLCGLVVACFPIYVLWRVGRVAAGFKAKILCSGVFVSQRDPDRILSEDLDGRRFPVLRTVAVDIDFGRGFVTARALGLIRRTAIFRPGLGCSLLDSSAADGLSPVGRVSLPQTNASGLWPEGEEVAVDVPEYVDAKALNEVCDKAFEEPNPKYPLRTRAVVVVHDGKIIAERYAPGFTPETPLLGWSMSKSILSALIGIGVGQGKLGLADRGLLPEWAPPDPRAEITVDQLLRMSSGLSFSENYRNPFKGVLPMLFDRHSASQYAAGSALRELPGTRWYYSSGTTNILARVLRNAMSDVEYVSFPRAALFDPIGMSTAVMEPDASGSFVGSSFMYASARDWARFGLLYLLDGVWKQQRILPEGWVEYSRMPSPEDARQLYGAHFWLGLPYPRQSFYPAARSLPADLFHARGYEGQYLVIIPSKKLVVVRLGLTPQMGAWDQRGFVASILDAIGDQA